MPSASFNNAIGATVRRLVPDKPGPLALRAVSALVLAPLVLAIVYLGAPYFDLLLTVVAAILAWEWARLCGAGEIARPGYLVIAAASAAMAAAMLREYTIAGWIIAVGAMAAAVLATREADRQPFWYALGILYAALPCLAIVWLRAQPTNGREIVFWIFFVVWATDTGAYAAGRAIGGPKLAPGISPNKTWAGLAGGVAAAGLVGMLGAWAMELSDPATMAGAGLGLALVSQAGDLFESGVKRRFGVKDSSNLIPGHGGLLDRLDGVLASALTVAVLIWLREVSL